MITYRRTSKVKKYSVVVKLILDNRSDMMIRRVRFLPPFKAFKVNKSERMKSENNKNKIPNIIDANCAWKAGYTMQSKLAMIANGCSSGQISSTSQNKQSA
jgi:hypothetical protein